jgi:flagellar basal-body rod protein FlgB
MDFSSIPLFGLMKAKLSYMSEQQSVLAQNVANADTPGYKAMDVAEPDFKAMLKSGGSGAAQKLQLVATNEKHMGGGAGAASMFKAMQRPNTDELNPDGNNVAIEEEMAKVGANQAEYQKVLNLYSKTISLFKIAIGNPNG